MRFKAIYKNSDSGKYVSKKFNNGDWDYWLIMDVVDMHDATGEEDQPKYNVSIQAVSPQAVGKPKVNQAMSSCGFSDEDIEKHENDPLFQVEALSDYGIYASLWNKSGDNIKVLLKDAHKETELINMLFGFYMDRPGNGIGQNGWDLIAGQDIRDYFKSREEV